MKRRSNSNGRWDYLCAFACILGYGEPVSASPLEQHTEHLQQPMAHEFGFKSGSLVGFPVPFQNPVLGTGLGVGAGYLFKDDANSNTSFVGLGGFKSDNGSLGYGLMASVALNENTWLFKSFLGKADLYYDLYGPSGNAIPIRQEGELVKASLSFGLTKDFSLGGEFRYISSHLSLGGGNPSLLGGIQNDNDTDIYSLGVLADWDTRDNTLYPTTGQHIAVSATGSAVSNQGDRTYGKAVVKFDNYFPTGEKSLVAARVAICGASSDTPFFDLCSLGGSDGFRGYPSTQLLGKQLASVQVAYRHRLTSRFGVVAFVGAGAVSDTHTGANDGDVKLAAGLGGRVRLSKKFPLDFSADISFNDANEQLVYIYVGQKF